MIGKFGMIALLAALGALCFATTGSLADGGGSHGGSPQPHLATGAGLHGGGAGSAGGQPIGQ
jgi:hypothetical protein